MDTIPDDLLIALKKDPQYPHIFNVEIEGMESLKAYNSVECHLMIYPYDRSIGSGDISLHPFEEYVKDISAHYPSAYVPIETVSDNLFGLTLSALIIAFFARFKPSDLLSVESVVAIMGAYFIGKDFWHDLERQMINLTKNWPVRYRSSDFHYQLERYTILTQYLALARQSRYSKAALLPTRLGFVEQSNSQAIRLCFSREDLRDCRDSTAHILSMHLNPERIRKWEQSGFLFGVKFSMNKSLAGMAFCLEIFQSIHHREWGSLDENNRWIPETLFYRRTLVWGRLKWVLSSGHVQGKKLIGMEVAGA